MCHLVSLLFAGLSSLHLVTFVVFFSLVTINSIIQYSISAKADREKPKMGKEPNDIRVSLSVHLTTCR